MMLFTLLLMSSWMSGLLLLQRQGDRRSLSTLPMWLLTGLAALAGGLHALVFTPLVFFVYLFAKHGIKKGRSDFLRLRPLSGFAIAAIIPALWISAAYLWGDGSGSNLLIFQNRFLGNLIPILDTDLNLESLENFSAAFLPWSILLPFVNQSPSRRKLARAFI